MWGQGWDQPRPVMGTGSLPWTFCSWICVYKLPFEMQMSPERAVPPAPSSYLVQFRLIAPTPCPWFHALVYTSVLASTNVLTGLFPPWGNYLEPCPRSPHNHPSSHTRRWIHGPLPGSIVVCQAPLEALQAFSPQLSSPLASEGLVTTPLCLEVRSSPSL